MSIATIAAMLLREAGVTADDVLQEAGIDRAGAVKEIASKLGVDINDLVESPATPAGELREITQTEVDSVRNALGVLNRAFQ